MADINVPNADDAANEATEKDNTELRLAYGHAVAGVKNMFADPAVPQYQKKNFFRALGDLGFSGILQAVATLTGQPDAQLALNSGNSTPDPVTAPAPPRTPTTPNAGTQTPADVENRRLKAQLDKVVQYVRDNGGSVIDGDLVATVNALVIKKENAAKAVPTDVIKKADVKKEVEALNTAINTGEPSKRPGENFVKYATGENTKMIKAADKLLELVG